MGSKKETELSQSRLDWWADGIDYETSPAEKTAEGFLIARAPLTSVGVFTYRNADGTPRRELRLPEVLPKTNRLHQAMMTASFSAN